MQTAVKERPLIMTGKSVRKIFAGEKTMTRRVIKPQPEFGIEPCPYSRTGWAYSDSGVGERCACTCKPVPHIPGHPGERLWIKETYFVDYEIGEGTRGEVSPGVFYKATDDGKTTYTAGREPWKSPLFMPRKLSRLLLEIKDVRIERVCSISPADARKEGYDDINEFFKSWDELNAKRGFSAEINPFVWVIEFEPVKEKE